MEFTGAQNNVGWRSEGAEKSAALLTDLLPEDIEYNSAETNEEDAETVTSKENMIVSSCTQGRNGDIKVYVNKATYVVCGTENTININGQRLEKKGTNITVDKKKCLEIVVSDDRNMFPYRLQRTGSFNGKRYHAISEMMRYFQDNGLNEKLEICSKQLLDRFREKGEFDLQVVTKIHRGISHIYQKNLSTAEVEINEAMALAEKAENRLWLIARCQLYLAHIFLYREEYKTAEEYVEMARSFLVYCVSSEDSALLLYLRGYIYMNLAGKGDEPCEPYERKAIECFDDEIMHAVLEENKEASQKKLRFATLKKITIFLRTYSPSMFFFEAFEKQIGEAKELMDSFEKQLWKDASPPARLHFEVLRADYCYRSGVSERALFILNSDAREQAKSIGHAPLVQMVESRIEIYQKDVLLTQKKVVPRAEISDKTIDELVEMDD